MGMKRSDSGSSFGAEPNRNTEWVRSPYFFFAYYGLVIASNWVVFLILRPLGKPYPAYSWSVINALHSALSFLMMHWLKGVPFAVHDGADQGRYDKDTFWEQIDDGRQWTPSKKKFIIVHPYCQPLLLLPPPPPLPPSPSVPAPPLHPAAADVASLPGLCVCGVGWCWP